MTTVRQALAEAAQRLTAAGVEGAPRDVRLLLAHALSISAERLMLDPDRALGEAEAGAFGRALAQRAARQPVAQIIGRREFWGRSFAVTRDTLDPRPETELLVATALEEPFARILDLGTGTGCILLSCLAERPDAAGLGTDVSAKALQVAESNARALGLQARAGFRQADWWDTIDGRFDLILSNPPYIGAGELAGLTPEVRDWEPRQALSPGADALAAYRAIAARAADFLAPGGRLAVECGASQGGEVAAILAAAPGLGGTTFRQDLDGRNRVVLARRVAPG